MLTRIGLKELEGRLREREPVDADTLRRTAAIVEEVRLGGDDALRRFARELDGLDDAEPLMLGRDVLEAALSRTSSEHRALLERTAARIHRFAEAQRHALEPMAVPIDGGRAGHLVAPVERAGCYAPGGGYPLPSSVLMTAVTARVAGVSRVVVASPRPKPIMLAAAAIAGADAFLCAGGAHAIAALAFGTASVPAVDVVAGPGNRWVTAAKKLVAGRVAIDMLAGPSELVVLADDSADPRLVAADLLAQAEHAEDALPIVVTSSRGWLDKLDDELSRQLETLPTAETARRALSNGFVVVCDSIDESLEACDKLAPEHLEVMTREPELASRRLSHYGALFIGPGSAEVLGDYGAGPNHTLPTGGSARYTGGLSVLTFLRVRTWMRLEGGPTSRELAMDAAALARIEGLEAHARAADLRR